LKYFHDEKTCVEFLTQQRWGSTVACPHCGNCKVYTTNRGYKCAEKTCAKKFSVTSGTIFENTKLPLSIWFGAMYLVTSHKKGISSLQLATDLGITQKTAWFLNHRIREMLKDKAPQMLDGMVELDETFVGAKAKNIHASKRKNLKRNANGFEHITPVFGLLQRGGNVITFVLPEVNKANLKPLMLNNVATTATICTDNFGGYRDLKHSFKRHEIVSHSNGEYVRGDWHTNTIEGYWSLLKRGIIGIYHFVSRKHLHRYCDEFSFRYNSRKIATMDRFENAFTNIEGRLTYKGLIA
jgi:transposase-like protein